MKRVIHNIQTGETREETFTTEEENEVKAAQAEEAKTIYKQKRALTYPPLADFADAMYWNSKGDSSKLTTYYAACEKVKSDNPKP